MGNTLPLFNHVGQEVMYVSLHLKISPMAMPIPEEAGVCGCGPLSPFPGTALMNVGSMNFIEKFAFYVILAL